MYCGRLGLGHLPQEPSIFVNDGGGKHHRRVGDNGMRRREQRKRVESVAEFGIEHVRNTREIRFRW